MCSKSQGIPKNFRQQQNEIIGKQLSIAQLGSQSNTFKNNDRISIKILKTVNNQCARKELYYTSGYQKRSSIFANETTSSKTTPSAPYFACFQAHRFCNLIVLIISGLVICNNCISGACAAPQSCILCDKNDLTSKDPNSNYEEFLFEHQVTRLDAITALKALNESFYKGASACAVHCSEKVMKYCVGRQFINDHCWCELGHTIEGLPFVPHICYVGEKMYTASVGSCYLYEEVKECCCAPVLAKQWRHISSDTRQTLNRFLQYQINILIIFHILVIFS